MKKQKRYRVGHYPRQGGRFVVVMETNWLWLAKLRCSLCRRKPFHHVNVVMERTGTKASAPTWEIKW